MNEYRYDEEYDELNLKACFFFVLKRYRSILIAVIIGCLVGCLFSYIKMKSNTPEGVLKTIENAEEINEEAVKQYANSVKLYKSILEYEDSSSLMSFDANNVYEGELAYAITSRESDTDEIVNYFKTMPDRDNGWEKLKESLSGDYSVSNLKEMIVIKSSNDIKTETGENIPNNINFSNSTYGFCTLDIKIFGDNETFVNEAMNYIKNSIDAAKKEVSNMYPSFSISKNKESIVSGFSQDLFDMQQEQFEKKQTAYNNMFNLEGKLSKDEKLYYNYHFNFDEFFTKTKNSFSKKFPVLFGVGFAALLVIVYLLIFVFKDVIRDEDSIRYGFGLPLLGSVELSKRKHNAIDNLIYKLENNRFNTMEYLNNMIKRLDNGKLAVSSDIKELNDSLDEKVKIVGNLDTDTKSVNDVDDVDDLVLVVKIDDTPLNSVIRQIETANSLNKKIVGFISVR